MNDEPVRVTIRLQPKTDPDLAQEIAKLGRYYGAKRLVALARIGLMVERVNGGSAMNASKQISLPSHVRSEHVPVEQIPSTSLPDADEPSEASSIGYQPNLSSLFNSDFFA